MKRFSIFVLVFLFILHSFCIAECIDLTSMSTDELIILRNQINDELIERSKTEETNPTEGLIYVSNGIEVHIKGYTGSEKDVVIPEKIDGVPVVSIDDHAFEKNKNINSVKLPSSLTYIGNNAFYCCTSLKYIYFPREPIDTLMIGYLAFDSTALTGIIVVNVKNLTVDWHAFKDCGSRIDTASSFVFLCDSVTFSQMPFYDSEIDYVYFKPNADVKFKYPDYAFGSSSVKAVYFPDNFDGFDENMFNGTNFAIVYGRDKDAVCIKEANNKFLLTNYSEYEVRTTQILNQVSEMGYSIQ